MSCDSNISGETLLYYLLCCLFLCVSYLGAFPVFPVSRTIPAFYAKIPAFYADIPCYLGFYAWYCAWCAVGGGRPCVARRHLKPHMWCYPGVQFNLPDRSPIPGPSLDPVTAGDWGADLRGSYVSRTLQRQL